MTMDKEIKDRWLTALRSGEYTQTQGSLERNGCNCCLGVLCRVQGLDAEDYDLVPGAKSFIFEYPANGHTVKLAGYPVDGFATLDTDLMYELAAFNDDGKTFEEIADIIEERA